MDVGLSAAYVIALVLGVGIGVMVTLALLAGDHATSRGLGKD